MTPPGAGSASPADGREAVYAGVDGGGTRSRVLLTDAGGARLHRAEGSSGIVDPGRPEAAASSIARLVGRSMAAAGVRAPLEALCAGLAGAGKPSIAAAVEKHLREHALARNVAVVGDGVIGLHGAFGQDAGILLLAGTGSVAFGRGEDGRVERCGGWGGLLGDSGSGYCIGLAGLRAAVRAVDGMDDRGRRILHAVLRTIDIDDPAELPAWAAAASKADIAALAPVVIGSAAEGDDAAGQILSTGVGDLAAHAVALARRLGPWSGDIPVAWTGGLTRSEHYVSRLREAIDRSLPEVRIAEVREDAVSGAARMARSVISPVN